MIRVMIVEDEPPTLRRIAGMVEKLDAAFSVVALAMNGQIALQKMAETEIDVVFTDIRMPVMNGLVLMDNIRERYPECIVVVLSGYSDFEYVSHAIRARSMDYLLKPVANDDMRALLTRIREQLNARGQARLKSSLSKYLNKASADTSGDDPSAQAMGICLLCAGAFPMSDDAEMYPAASFWNDHSLEAIAQHLVPGFMDFTWEFMGNTPVERILIFRPQGDAFIDWARLLHESLLGEGTPIGCACLGRLISMNETNGALKQLRRALRNKTAIGHSLFLALDEHSAPADKPFLPDAQLTHDWAQAFLTGYTKPGTDLTRSLIDQIAQEKWTQKNILDFFLDVALLMQREGTGNEKVRTQQYQSVLAEAICTSLTLDDLENKIRTLIPEPLVPEDTMRQAKVVDDIERYLHEHYAEHITNQTLASVFGYVPSYLSLLFRQRYTLSPSEYLTQIRMEQAKELMKAHPDMLMREVAEQVGFKSQHHFSRIFKKNEGVWPSGYQS